MDPDRFLRRVRDRCTNRLLHADDGGTATDRYFSRVWRACVSPDWDGRVFPESASRIRHGGAYPRDPARISDLHRQPDGIRQTARDFAHQADYLEWPKLVQFRSFWLRRRNWYRAHYFTRANLAV